MQSISNPELLGLWEHGSHLHPLDQGLLILKTGFRESDSEAFADWSLGARNLCLYEWYSRVFGPMLEGWLSCPDCSEKLEFSIDGRELFKGEKPSSDQLVTVCGHSFRLPSSRDLARSLQESDPILAATCIVESCLLPSSAKQNWPEAAIDEIGQSMATADPMAEIVLHFRCPNCAREWEEDLEIVQFAWAAIEGSAKRLLRDVHVLAHAYGWSEADILSLSGSRRSFYLQMVQQ